MIFPDPPPPVLTLFRYNILQVGTVTIIPTLCHGVNDVLDTTPQVVGETEEVINTGCWVGDCLIYTNSVNRLNYYVGGEIVTVAHFDRSVSRANVYWSAVAQC